MNKSIKRLTTSVAVITALTAASNFMPHVSADKIEIEPMFTYGESLDNTQFEETKDVLGVEDGAEEIEVQIDELNGLLQDDYPYNQVYSSTYITPAQNDGDISVEIMTPETITAITPLQYENAALTAGAVDVDIKVGSSVPVDGSGALAGVYKAFESQGGELDEQAVGVAQDELAVTSSIAQENEGQEGFSDESLNGAIAEIKDEIQQSKEANGGTINADEITIIVNNIVNNYNLNGVLSEENVQSITNQMQNFSDLELSEEQKSAISDFGQNIKDAAGNVVEGAESAWNNVSEEDKQEVTEQATGLWDSIVQFFTNLFNTLFGGEN